MQTKDDGGPAFPRQELWLRDGDGANFHQDVGALGMSLRDYFAAQVISQCHITVEKHAPDEPDPMLVEAYAYRYARTAYAIADAMLVERQKFKQVTRSTQPGGSMDQDERPDGKEIFRGEEHQFGLAPEPANRSPKTRRPAHRSSETPRRASNAGRARA